VIAQSKTDVSELLLGGLVWLLPTALLVVSAVLVSRQQHRRRPCQFAACVALAVAAWQVCLLVISLAGPGSPGPFLLAVKLGVLVVVVVVDLAAALLLLRSRSRLEEGEPESVQAPRRFGADVLLLVIAAACYVVSIPLLSMTG
jgi:hypothetical protein